ncbi:MAG: phage/plasmid primase, P4 family [Tsuneonella sp.]
MRVRPGALAIDGKSSTEESLAREWVCNHAREWRFDHGSQRWFAWDGSRWRQDRTRAALQLIREHLREAAEGRSGDTKPAPALAKTSVARAVETFCQIDPRIAVEHDVWDSDPFQLGTPEAVVDLRTGKRGTPDRLAMITRSTTVSPQDGEPTRWIQFIHEVTNGDLALAYFLQLALGYCLTGSTREHALFFGFGGGKNGKSVLLNTVSRIMGDYATTAAMDTFTASRGDKHPTDLARLDGARLVAASETEEGRAWAEARIKQLTGGDRIAARFMRQDFFEFTPRFKLFIVGNFRPRLHNVDEATRRRFNIIPFLHTPLEPDKDLEDKLKAEHPQILAWMIEGALQWYANGLSRPQAIADATDRYFEDQDLIGQWIAERCETRAGAMGRATPLFDSWRDFARESGEPEGTQRAFAEALHKRGFERDRVNALGRIYRGVDLRGRRIEE